MDENVKAEIDQAVKHLYDLCREHDVPMFAVVVTGDDPVLSKLRVCRVTKPEHTPDALLALAYFFEDPDGYLDPNYLVLTGGFLKALFALRDKLAMAELMNVN